MPQPDLFKKSSKSLQTPRRESRSENNNHNARHGPALRLLRSSLPPLSKTRLTTITHSQKNLHALYVAHACNAATNQPNTIRHPLTYISCPSTAECAKRLKNVGGFLLCSKRLGGNREVKTIQVVSPIQVAVLHCSSFVLGSCCIPLRSHSLQMWDIRSSSQVDGPTFS